MGPMCFRWIVWLQRKDKQMYSSVLGHPGGHVPAGWLCDAGVGWVQEVVGAWGEGMGTWLSRSE